MSTSLVPTETFHHYAGTGEPTPVPPDDFQQLVRRVDVLERDFSTMNTQITAHANAIKLLTTAAKRMEFVFNSYSVISEIEGGLWKVCGTYRCFENMTLNRVGGYSLNWPSGSLWQVSALRASGAREVQEFTTFSFDSNTSLNPTFDTGDLLIILVRNFEETIPGTDDNYALSRVIFTRTVL